MKHTAFLSAILLLSAVSAGAGTFDAVHTSVITRANEADSGVILAVSDLGQVAAETASLLNTKTQQDGSYAPLLLVLTKEDRESKLSSLNLTENDLPALIFYNKQGQEIRRVVDALDTLSKTSL